MSSRVDYFVIEDDQINKGPKILVAVDENGGKWVVGGDHFYPPVLIPYEDAYNAQPDPRKAASDNPNQKYPPSTSRVNEQKKPVIPGEKKKGYGQR